ncbi:MAG: hypothetical protein QXP72_02590 [Desulfurococcaceae archaeon]
MKSRVDKVYYEDQNDYRMIILDYRGSSYLLCLFRFCDRYIYGKIVELDSTSYLDCESIVYSMPEGLYIYAKSIDEFLDKIIDKINWLRTRASSINH